MDYYYCQKAFESGDHAEAVRLLPLVIKPHGTLDGTIIVWFDITLLHLSSRNGWLDVTKDLITNYHFAFDPQERDHEGKTCLQYAAESNRVDVVRYLITECNCDPMATDYNGDTVLHRSTAHGSLDVMKYLINHHNCNLMATNRWGETILHCAVGHIEVVKYLIIKCNCDPMTVNNDGDTILHYAAKKGLLDVMKYLINHHNCNPIATNKRGETILYFAVEHINIVKYLIIECNCDPMTVNDDGDTILHYAAKKGSLDVMKYLINHHNCNLMASLATNKLGETILHFAMEHIEVVKYLIIECNCDPMTVINNYGDTVLHYAAEKGLLDLLKFMINHHNCNLMATNKQGKTILHCAMEHIKVVKYLIIECNCDPMTVINNYGDTVLHYAAKKGLLDLLKATINHHNCNLMATNRWGVTILHCAVEHIEIVKYLIIECNCDPMTVINDDGDTVLHYAAKKGLLDLLKFIINHHNCNLMATNKWGETILHCALKHIEVVKYLIFECDCDPMTVINKQEDTILHYAAKKGLLDLLKFMINHHNCNLMATNKQGETILHCAVEHIEVVKYLINECNCDPMVVDMLGQTPLHTATYHCCSATIEYLLSTGRCDPLVKDNEGRTPVQIAQRRPYTIVPIFKKFGQIKVSHPIDSYVNVLLLGNPGAGKSTLRHVISDTATGSIAFGSFRNVKGVVPFTAGIIPVKLQHKALGNIILHDFAGHSEYYSSHGAVIENLLQGSGGVFLIVVNILEKEAVKQLYQWLTVVRNEAEKALDQCHVIVVVSHVDEKCNPIERRVREEEIQEIIQSKRLDSVFIDCRKLGGSGIGIVFKMLSSTCESIRNTKKYKSTLYHHEMYRLLEERKENILTLLDVISEAQDNDSFVIPEDSKEILELLCSLDSTGLINVLQSEDKVWVVLNKGILLTEVDGILFAPKDFKEHIDIASNTGMVSVSDLACLFPDYDPDLLICFLKKMELCQEMNDPSFLNMTNLIPSAVEGSEEERDTTRRGERLLFFPCLLYSIRPAEMTSKVYQFGWCLQCTGEHDYFPPRYFHVLSLHLAYTMALPREDDKLNRRCTFWRNGLHWLNDDGVGVLLEIVDENQCVLVLMSHQKKGCSDSFTCFRRDVIREVLLAQKESCPSLEVKEFIIDPKELSYPVETPRKRTLHSVKDVISLILKKKDFLVNATGTRAVELKSILTDESLSDINNLSLLGGRDIKVRIHTHTSVGLTVILYMYRK